MSLGCQDNSRQKRIKKYIQKGRDAIAPVGWVGPTGATDVLTETNIRRSLDRAAVDAARHSESSISRSVWISQLGD